MMRYPETHPDDVVCKQTYTKWGCCLSQLRIAYGYPSHATGKAQSRRRRATEQVNPTELAVSRTLPVGNTAKVHGPPLPQACRTIGTRPNVFSTWSWAAPRRDGLPIEARFS